MRTWALKIRRGKHKGQRERCGRREGEAQKDEENAALLGIKECRWPLEAENNACQIDSKKTGTLVLNHNERNYANNLLKYASRF